MFGSHFYDEICEDQDHIYLVAQICLATTTEEEIMAPSTVLLIDNSTFKNRLKSAEINDTDIQALNIEMQNSCRIKNLRLFDDSDEYLLAEFQAIPYVPNPNTMRVIRSHSQGLLYKSISIDQLRECCTHLHLQQAQVQYKPSFINRHYHISKSGVVTLVPDSLQ